MTTKNISCVSYHATGSGAVDDFLREFDNINSAKSEIECRFLQDPDGISDLEYNLVENPHRLNSGFALKRYMIFVRETQLTYRKIFGKKWIEYSQKYVNSLTKFSYKAYWHGDLRIMPKLKLLIYYFRRLIAKILPKKIRRPIYYNYFPNIDSYHSFVSEEEFLEITREYVEGLCQLLNKDNKEFLVLDQLVPTMNIKRYSRYINNLKVIVVDMDPRGAYLNSILHGDHVVPVEVEKFCQFYKDTRKSVKEEMKNSNVLFINFEDMIYKYDNTTTKIMNFLGLNKKNHVFKKKFFDPKISKKNTRQWIVNKQYEEQIKYIERELSEYLYKFED